ncbi:MAG TPA: uracil-DNA glycosylase family protein, partial [Gemmatimonadaceae bacterium]|nr:uracil-DNA glycosylase family protein [Gemmatimonadaceae bacterium]
LASRRRKVSGIAIRSGPGHRWRRMSPSTFGSRALRFYTGLVPPDAPAGIDVMNPYADRRVRRHLRAFLDKYYGDDAERVLVLGINPGRFGAGLTGITFTDPVALADHCGIENDWPRRRELSSNFIYRFVERFGGAGAFYRRFFLTAVSPLGFVRDGKNLNYYDVPALRASVTPFITAAIRRQIAIGGRRDHAIILGMGANLDFVKRLNDEHRFFETIHGLEHPRFIMQYRRRRLDEYLEKYAAVFSSCG